MAVEKNEAPHSRNRTRLRDVVRRLLRLVDARSSRDVEHEFVWRNVVGEKVRILDVGGSDSLLPLLFAKQGHNLTVYDFRLHTERHENLTTTQGDFLGNDLRDHCVDYVTLISVIEHTGLGSYGAPR